MYLSIYGDLSTKGLIQFAREMEENSSATGHFQWSYAAFANQKSTLKFLSTIALPGHPSLRYRNRRRQCCSRRPGRFHQDQGGDYLLKTRERKEVAKQYENIPIISKPDGTKAGFATWQKEDDFEESQREPTSMASLRFDGCLQLRIPIATDHCQSC